MPTQIVRLHRRPDARSPQQRAAGRPDRTLQVLERSAEELARAARLGGQVWDVTVELGHGPVRKCAEEVLKLALLPVDELAENAGARARARRAVVVVPLPQPTNGPLSRKAGRGRKG